MSEGAAQTGQSKWYEDLGRLHTFLLNMPIGVLEELVRVDALGFYMWQRILRPADTEPVWTFDLLPSPDVCPDAKVDKERLILLPIDSAAIVRHALGLSGQNCGTIKVYERLTEASVTGKDGSVLPLFEYAFGVYREHEAAVGLLHKVLLKVRGKNGLD